MRSEIQMEIEENSPPEQLNSGESLLKRETGVTKELLLKIAHHPQLRRAFTFLVFSLGLFVGEEALSQEIHQSPHLAETSGVLVKQEKKKNGKRLKQEVLEYLRSHEHFSKYPDLLMSWAAAVEKPTSYQAEQMVALLERISRQTEEREFPAMADRLEFINAELDPDFPSEQAFVFLKDAFPKKGGGRSSREI